MSAELELMERAAHHHHLVTTAMVSACGISPARWLRMQDAGLWLRVTPGHYRHVATPLTFEMQVRAGAGWLGRDAALFGATALSWLGVDVPQPRRAEFVLPRSRTSVVSWLTIRTSRRWDRRDIINHRGVQTSTGTRALIDLATVERSAAELEQAIDSAVAHRRTALPRLRTRLSEVDGRGRAGGPLLRELLLDTGGESHLERRFLRLVRLNGLPKPRCQVTFRPSSSKPIRVDFLFEHVVVEVSGRLGHSTSGDRRRDAHRRNTLQQLGLEVLEFTTADVIDSPDVVVATLRASLARRSIQPELVALPPRRTR